MSLIIIIIIITELYWCVSHTLLNYKVNNRKRKNNKLGILGGK